MRGRQAMGLNKYVEGTPQDLALYVMTDTSTARQRLCIACSKKNKAFPWLDYEPIVSAQAQKELAYYHAVYSRGDVLDACRIVYAEMEEFVRVQTAIAELDGEDV